MHATKVRVVILVVVVCNSHHTLDNLLPGTSLYAILAIVAILNERVFVRARTCGGSRRIRQQQHCVNRNAEG